MRTQPMKLLNSDSSWMPLHVFSQTVYIFLSLKYFANQRDLTSWLLVLLFGVLAYALHAFFVRKLSKEFTLVYWSALAISNSVYLNLDADQPLLYMAAILIGIFGISFFSINGRHAFNPSILGSLTCILLFPSIYTYTSWSQNPGLQLTILILGLFTAYKNNSLRISMGYWFGFILFALIATYFQKNFGGSNERNLTYLFWISTLSNPSNLIFTFHVITDPSTSPKSFYGKLIFGFSIGTLDVLLRAFPNLLISDLISYSLVQGIYWLNSNDLIRSKLSTFIGKFPILEQAEPVPKKVPLKKISEV